MIELIKMETAPKIRVVVRKRPLTQKENSKGDADVITMTGDQTLYVAEPRVKVDLTKYIENHEFKFDNVFGENSTNK